MKLHRVPARVAAEHVSVVLIDVKDLLDAGVAGVSGVVISAIRRARGGVRGDGLIRSDEARERRRSSRAEHKAGSKGQHSDKWATVCISVSVNTD